MLCPSAFLYSTGKNPKGECEFISRHAPHEWVSWICRLVDLTSSSTCSSLFKYRAGQRVRLWRLNLQRGSLITSAPQRRCSHARVITNTLINIKAWGKNVINILSLALSVSIYRSLSREERGERSRRDSSISALSLSRSRSSLSLSLSLSLFSLSLSLSLLSLSPLSNENQTLALLATTWSSRLKRSRAVKSFL